MFPAETKSVRRTKVSILSSKTTLEMIILLIFKKILNLVLF